MSLKRTTTVLIFFLSTLTFRGQDQELDSLFRIAGSARHDTAVANAWLQITELIGYSYPDTVIPLCRKALAIAGRATPRTAAEKKAFLRIRANCYNNIGLIFLNQGDIAEALDNFHLSLKLMEENKDKTGIVLILNNMGSLFRNQGDNLQALDHYMRAYKIAKATGDKDGTSFSLGNIGVIYSNQGQYDKAIGYYKRSMKIREEVGYTQGVAMSLHNIGYAYEKKGLPDTALSYFERSLKTWKEIDDKDGASYTMSNIGEIYFRKGDYTKAGQYAKEALKIGQEIAYPEDIRDAADLLHRVYRAQKNWQMALEMQDLYISMKDSLNNEESRKTAIRKQLQYEYDKEKLELAKEQEKKELIRNEEKQRQRIISWSVTGVLVLVVVFSLFLFNRFRVIRNQKMIIEEQKHLVEEKQKEVIDSIRYARRIQNTLLASDALLQKNLGDVFVFYRPKDIVSGDFYWAAEKDGSFFLAVCDSTGHGVPGAFMSLLNVSFLNEAITEKNLSACNLILDHVRSRLIGSVSQDGAQDGMDGILLSIDATQKISYAAAYNSPVIIRSGEAHVLPADKMPVGKGERQAAFSLFDPEVKKGDKVYLYTDGFADQFGGPKGKKFKYRQLNDLLLTIHHLPMTEQKQVLERSFLEWKGNHEQVDDVCIVGISFAGI